MYSITKKQIRPSTAVEFYRYTATESNPDENYFVKTYVTTGKWLLSDRTAEDDLTLVITTVWESKAASDEFRNDPNIIQTIFKERDDYFATTGVTEILVSEVEI